MITLWLCVLSVSMLCVLFVLVRLYEDDGYDSQRLDHLYRRVQRLEKKDPPPESWEWKGVGHYDYADDD